MPDNSNQVESLLKASSAMLTPPRFIPLPPGIREQLTISGYLDSRGSKKCAFMRNLCAELGIEAPRKNSAFSDLEAPYEPLTAEETMAMLARATQSIGSSLGQGEPAGAPPLKVNPDHT